MAGERARARAAPTVCPMTTARVVQAEGPSFVRKHRPVQRIVCVKLEEQYHAPPSCVQPYFPNVPMITMSRRRAGQR